MTRETKIGLLVGLGFIIVIGVLLSDHIQTATEPPQARLAMVGQNVRSAVNSPGTSGPQAAVVTAPESVAPAGTVMTHEDLAERPAPVKIIRIAPAGSDGAGTSVAPAVAGSNDLVVSRTPDVSPLAASNPVELTPVSAGNLNDARPVSALAGAVDSGLFTNRGGGDARALDAAVPARAVDRKYVAVAGDTLSKICRKFFGSNDKKYMDLVVAVNKDLKGDRGHIVIGHAYTIPAKPVEATAAEVAGIAPATQPASSVVVVTTDRAVTQRPAAAAATATRWYTVKENDNLWKIATQQLGSGSPKNIAAIRELNRDVIKGDSVRANAKIKLPARQVATTE